VAHVWLEPDSFSLFLLGAGAPALALAGLFGRGRARECDLAAGALAALAAAAAAAGWPARDWMSALALAAACLLFRLLRSAPAARAGAALLGLARRPRAQWLALLAAGPLVAFGWAWGWTQSVEVHPGFGTEGGAAWTPLRLEKVTDRQAATDGDRPVALYRPDQTHDAASARAHEETVLQAWLGSERLIRTAPPDEAYNCHGWVFAAGRFWVNPADVEAALEDNGYRAVDDPQPDDVAVFRDARGALAHTGVVRAVIRGGPVLVESKWGLAGRYLHAAADQPFGPRIAYYRSPRVDHTLLGVGAPPPGYPAGHADAAAAGAGSP
jgi:hypothetical protein